jgi:hypothetical protein
MISKTNFSKSCQVDLSIDYQDKKSRKLILFYGYLMYHNYIRPHMALEGKTPAEACGVKIEGDNKWMTLIQNASKKP